MAEVMIIPSHPVDFIFESACTTPYMSAPSSPRHFGNFFFSAPTSPTRISALYDEFNQKSGEINTTHDEDDSDNDFAFEFSGQLERISSIISAAELFDGGKIKPLELSQMLRDEELPVVVGNDRRERERTQKYPENSSSSRRHMNDHENIQEITENSVDSDCSDSCSSSTVSSMISLWYKKWNLKDLLLSRSASEQSQTNSSTEEQNKNASFRLTGNNVGSSASSSRRKRRPISAHELHYRMKREVSKEMKKKTFLPYKQSLMGCSGFDDTISTYMTRRQ